MLAGCGGDDEPAAREAFAGAARGDRVPALPDDVLLQLFVPETEELYRVAEDGRYTSTSGPRSRARSTSPGRDTVSPEGLSRLREALAKAGFFALPSRIDTGDCIPDGR